MNPKPWSASPRGIRVIIGLIAVLAVVLVVVLIRGLSNDPSSGPTLFTGETSAGDSHAAVSPAATRSPDSKP